MYTKTSLYKHVCFANADIMHKCANTHMLYALGDVFMPRCMHRGVQRLPHKHTSACANRHQHTCICTDRCTRVHRIPLFAPMNVSPPMGTHTGTRIRGPLCTTTHTNTNQWPVRILCLKKSCDCIKNVGHISQIIKVRSVAVGLPATLSGPPALGWAQRGFILCI